jgi:hypothetical protein
MNLSIRKKIVFMMQLTNGGGDTADEINSFMSRALYQVNINSAVTVLFPLGMGRTQ